MTARFIVESGNQTQGFGFNNKARKRAGAQGATGVGYVIEQQIDSEKERRRLCMENNRRDGVDTELRGHRLQGSAAAAEEPFAIARRPGQVSGVNTHAIGRGCSEQGTTAAVAAVPESRRAA